MALWQIEETSETLDRAVELLLGLFEDEDIDFDNLSAGDVETIRDAANALHERCALQEDGDMPSQIRRR